MTPDHIRISLFRLVRIFLLTGMGMLTKKQRDFRLQHFPPRDLQYHVRKFGIGGVKIVSVQVKENERGHRTDTFVSIHEGMVFNEVVEICRRHFNDGRMEILSAEGGGRHPDRRSQEFDIAKTFAPAEIPDLIVMNLDDFRKGQEQRFMLYLASSSKDFM